MSKIAASPERVPPPRLHRWGSYRDLKGRSSTGYRVVLWSLCDPTDTWGFICELGGGDGGGARGGGGGVDGGGGGGVDGGGGGVDGGGGRVDGGEGGGVDGGGGGVDDGGGRGEDGGDGGVDCGGVRGGGGGMVEVMEEMKEAEEVEGMWWRLKEMEGGGGVNDGERVELKWVGVESEAQEEGRRVVGEVSGGGGGRRWSSMEEVNTHLWEKVFLDRFR